MMKLRPCLFLLLLWGCGQSEKEDAVVPEPEPQVFEVPSSEVSFGTVVESAKNVTITSSQAWSTTITYPDGKSGWLTVSPSSGGSGEIKVRLTAGSHFSGTASRQATVTFTSGTLTRRIPVSQAAPTLSLDSSSASMDMHYGTKSVTITTNLPLWSCTSSDETWCKVSKPTENTFQIEALTNTGGRRTATITITAGGLTPIAFPVEQAACVSGNTWSDKDWLKLQSATKGNGIDLILMGDGYNIQRMTKTTGKYEVDMRAAMEHFFSVYPLSNYRDYFNVYMVVAVSEQEGMSSPTKSVNTAFQSLWAGSGSTSISCNYTTVEQQYIPAIPALAGKPLGNMTVLMPINEYQYAGTCRFVSTGFSVSMVPVCSTFRNVVVHECCGHGFAKLADEYIRSGNSAAYITDADKATVLKWKNNYGFYPNVDLYDNIAQTGWRDFAGVAKYSMVGTWEGARYYGKGIWRPEYNSCMNNNVLYFNAPSRWAQVSRVMKLAGINYTLADFIRDEVVPAYPVTVSRSPEITSIPLGEPIAEME